MDNINVIAASETEVDEVDYNDEVKILCLIWKNGKLGAAYYNITNNLLYIYEEVHDVGPQFVATKCLYHEVLPKYTLCCGTSSDIFSKNLIDIILAQEQNTTISDDVRSLPPNFYFLSMKEYSYEVCKTILLQVKISSNLLDNTNDIIQEMYIHSLVNFDYKMSVHAIGALIKYIDKNWAYFSPNKELEVFHIQQICLKNNVLIDWTSFNALHVFQQKSHEASFKRGTHSSNREGLSIFKLFSAQCKSKLGQTCLKNILLNPTNELDELNKRHNFIQFLLQPGHKEFIEAIQDNIKNISDINVILLEIQNSKASRGSWRILYNVIYHSVIINELCRPYREESELLKDLHNSISSDLIGLQHSFENAFDFTRNLQSRRPIIKYGLDEQLDAKKLQCLDMAKHVTAAAQVAVNELPDFLTECAVVYLPEMGYLIAIKEWTPNCDPEEIAYLGFQFMFTLRNTIHYKSPLCDELDKSLGDINAEIIAHENRIIQRMTGFVLKYNRDIREPLKIIALIDSLTAMARVAEERNYVRPSLNDEKMHEIEEGRHPLMELVCTLVPNDFHSGGVHSRMKLITGPNGSGKSLYLKQMGIIIYLAHIGSYVPAKRANIGLVHSIHCRMQATESIAVQLSAFMIDITQATQALFNAKSSSLVIMDEFGRGTSDEDGLALLVSLLKNYLKMDYCPHVLIATHCQEIQSHIEASPLVEYLKMDHAKENEKTLFLYKITQGVSESYTFEIATEVGLNQSIIDRAKEIFDCLKNNKPLTSLYSNKKFDVLPEELNEFLLHIDIPELDEDN